MCFYSKQTKSAQELQNRFNATIENEASLQPAIYNGFQYPKTPVITNTHPNTIRLFNWGLIPFWAKDDSIKKHTLNARIETIHEKPAFRNSVNNHCLILADGFFEWQWLDKAGKNKQKYVLTLPNDASFAFAGLWSEWIDKSTGEIIHSYTILTTEANTLMSKIHNTKKRMPVIVAKNNETAWLMGQPLIMQNDRLIATAV
jgi:putative SOS response-associated peptidase YedK